VRSLQPTDVDLVEMFSGDATPFGAPPAGPLPFADDFLVEFISNVPGVGRITRRGLDGFVDGWRDWLEAYGTYRISAEEYIDGGDKVVVLIKVRATTARGGVVVEHDPAVVWTLANGSVVAVRMYLEREEALREAG
jgi:ketosteroid isomerase-like protein